jgi:integrase
MATIVNRSPFAVSVRSRADLYQEFPVFRRTDADTYVASLARQGLKSKLVQLENAFQVLARDRGYPRFCATFDNYAEAEKTRKKLDSERALCVFRDFAAATRTTSAELVERYIDEVCPGHKGGETEIYRLRRLLRCETFVHKPLAKLTTEDLQDFITDRLTEVAPSTVDRDLDVLRQVLNYAADVWKIAPAESPFAGLRRPKYFNERDRRLRGDEEARLLAAARACGNPWYEPIIILALETAMRRSEILSLTWDNIDFQARTAFLPVTKNGRSRRVPLSAVALQVLEALPRDGERVFPVSANAIKLAWSRTICPAAGIENLHFHDLRHEATSRLAESGLFTLVELQAVTGHRDTRMLLRYSHLCATKLAEKMDKARLGTMREYIHRGRKRCVVDALDVDVTPCKRRASNIIANNQATGESNVIPLPFKMA